MIRRNLPRILVFITFVLAVLYFVFAWFGPKYDTATIPYPLLRFFHATIFPFVALILLGTAATFLLLIYHLITQRRRLDSERPARRTAGLFILFLIATFIAAAAALPAIFVSAQHLSSASSGGHVYQLSFWLFIDGDHRYIFYECDSLGFMCQQRHIQFVGPRIGTIVDLLSPADHAAINTDDNTISLQIDGETVYSQ